MKFRFALIAAFAALLAACNFTLAEDVTPPPGYVPPTPMPTLGPLFPAQAPSVENGAAIYVEKCLPCHGAAGLGDGEQGIQLGVTVRAFGLPEIARPASPAQYYTAVTRGNIERFMPPFTSLNDQQRWDVVAYVMTLHTPKEEIQKGRKLFEANCANCPTDFFKNQEKMSALSEVELARMIRQGNDEVKAFGSNLTDDDVWAIAAYLRTLSFGAAPLAQPTVAPVIGTPLASNAGTPTQSAQGTPVESAAQTQVPGEALPTPKPGFGAVSGSVENKSGAALSSDLKITLRGYDHGADPSAGAQEVLTLDGTANKDGTFAFENVELVPRRIFIAEAVHEGVPLQSGFAMVAEGVSTLTLPPITLYATTTDTSALVMDEVRLFFEYGGDKIQVFEVYSFRNTTDKIIVAPLKDGVEIPFIKPPEGAQSLGYEPMQGSQRPVSTDKGLAIPPNEQPYELIAFSTLAKDKKVEVAQPFVLPVTSLTVFLPEGVKADGARLNDHGVQAMQGLNFQLYASGSINAGETVSFTLSGTPREASASTATPATNTNQNLLIGAGVLGLALILAGGWMYFRDRNRVDDEEEEDAGDEFESSEDVMDAILALDDLHRAGKISDDAYQKRRAELKEILRNKSRE